MKKLVKWYKRFSFYTKLKVFLGSFGIGGELALFYMDAHPKWKIIAGVATILSLLITLFIEDKDGDDVIDGL